MDPKTAARVAELEKSVNDRIATLEKNTTNAIVGSGNQSTFGRSGSQSDESRLLAAFSAKSLGELLQINVAHPRFKHVSEDKKHAVVGLKQTFDLARFQKQIFSHLPKDPEAGDDGRVPAIQGILDTPWAKNAGLKALCKSFSSTVAGDGDEFVPTVISANYIEELELERKLAGAMKELPMTSNPWQLPVQTDVTRARLIGEGTAITDVNFGTDKIQFDAVKLGEYFLLPEELNEDSAPAILELARREVIESQLRAVEDAILNGDNSGTHMDSDVTLAGDNRKAWKGLRKLALAASSTVDFNGGAITEAFISDMRKRMGKYGTNPSMLAWVCGPASYVQMQNLERFVSLEKFGPQATNMSGSLGKANGISVLVSEFVRENLNANGVYDGVTTNRTALYLVNVSRFYLGRRRPIRVRVQQDARLEHDRFQLVSYQRLDFKGHKQAGEAYASGTVSDERSVVLGIDILS